ncbi:hypothetical protein ACGFMK_08730 [Amycolatopsis sp. NPDC049252]|uniref:hypothetical protein n=1 Tax=Amycolatopsis sp. NPDC049252 TaxID=3363933 RepID=UPI00371D8937
MTRPLVDGVVVTGAGRAEVAQVRPVPAAAGRAQLVEPLGKADRATFFVCLAALAESCD